MSVVQGGPGVDHLLVLLFLQLGEVLCEDDDVGVGGGGGVDDGGGGEDLIGESGGDQEG